MFERRAAAEARILLTDPDPYLAFLIRQEFPNVRVDETCGRSQASVSDPPDVVIAEVDDPSEIEGTHGGARVISIVDATKAPKRFGREGATTLVRPYLPSEVHRTVRSALGLPVEREAAGTAARVREIAALARITGVALAVVIELATRVSPPRLLLGALLAYSVERAFVRAGRIGALADVSVAAGVVAVTGGAHSAFAPFGLIAVVGAGFELGAPVGAAAGLFVAATALPGIVHVLGDRSFGSMQVVAWFGLFCLGGFSGGLATRISGLTGAGAMLAEANRILSNLYRIARAMPGGLEPGIIADSVMTEIKNVTAAPAAAMIVRRVGTYAVAGSYGLVTPEALAGNHWESDLAAVQEHAVIVPREALPRTIAAVWNGYACLIAAPIRRDASTFGVLICACPDHALHSRNKAFVERLAQECAVGVENAELFARVREMSIDEERQRLARDLHDGVAQAITHLRLELDLLARRAEPNGEFRDDLERLARVMQRTGADVREMILGLRSPVSSEGLAAAIRSYVRDMRRFGGPEVEFIASGILRAAPEVEAEVFRVAQEAVSNALHHAQARRISVVLSIGVDELRLSVSDDGVGFNPARPYDGVGLNAMRERAAYLGATLRFERVEGGGTRVELVCPMTEAEIA